MTQTYRIENNSFAVTLRADGNRFLAALRDARSGREWGPVPLLELEIRDRMQDRTDRLREYKALHIEGGERELHLIAREAFRGITVGLWMTLTDDGELRVLVPPAEVEEAKEALYRLYAVDVLPGLLSAGADGRLLLPVNTGYLCSPAGKEKLADRFLIYGEQERWELVPTVPVCGAQTPAGGLIALATQGATDMYCGVRTDGKGSGSVGLYPMFRREWIDPVDWTEREIRLAPLEAKDDLVVTAAQRLRRHIVEDLGKATLKQRAAESPQCAYQQQAYTMKTFHGIQQQGIMMYGRESHPDAPLFKRTLSFADAVKCFRRLKAAGIERVYLQTVGWNPKGHDGAWPTDFPVDRRLGGETGFRAMIAEAKALGYHITTHLNMVSSCFGSPDFHRDWVITDIWGEAKVVGFWGGGVKSAHWGLAVPEEFLRGRLERLKTFGINGMQYLDGMGNPLYINYHRTNGGPRRDHAAGINRYLDLAREVFGAVATEFGFLYCATHTDALCAPFYMPHAPWKTGNPEWVVCGLLDIPAPVFQLATHDLVTQEQQGLGWLDAMNAVLFGHVMRDEWSAEPGVMPVLDDERIARIKAIYDLVTVRFGHLVTQPITDWKRLAAGVEQTRFADGAEVVADFNEQRLSVNGEEISRPSALI